MRLSQILINVTAPSDINHQGIVSSVDLRRDTLTALFTRFRLLLLALCIQGRLSMDFTPFLFLKIGKIHKYFYLEIKTLNERELSCFVFGEHIFSVQVYFY